MKQNTSITVDVDVTQWSRALENVSMPHSGMSPIMDLQAIKGATNIFAAAVHQS